MTNKTKHPTADELTAFTLGQLPLNDAQDVEAHISVCDPCCQTMLGLSSEDTFVDLLQTADQQPSIALSATSPTTMTEADKPIPLPLSTHPRYKIEQLVGQGGMGRVFKARHRIMDRAVALKVIHQAWVRKPEAVDRFQREVKAAASLDHPNIVTAYDAEQADNLHFLVMEFVDGIDLAETVIQNGPLPIAKACEYIRQAAQGLQHAHNAGMVHRDIKPHNLVVTTDGVIKILDFGLASLVPQASDEDDVEEDTDGNLTIAGTIMGTPDFISPEQARDAHSVDGRSDIYSLGMTLYFLLAGRAPFTEGTAAEKLKAHAENEPLPLTGFRDDVPKELQAIVTRMTAKDPAKRFQSPNQIAEALKSFVLNSAEPSASLPIKPPTASVAKKRLAKTALVAGFAFLAMSLFVAAAVLLNGALTKLNAAAVPDEVHGPLVELDSYVAAMMASPHDPVFLNLGDVGKDYNYFTFKPTKGGIEMDFPAMDGHRHSRRQGKYVERLKQVADSFSLKPDEESTVSRDGTVDGVHFRFSVTGSPEQVATTIRNVIMQTFDVGDTEECEFVFQNLPAQSSAAVAGGPKRVTGDAFVKEYERGQRVYFGEVNNSIYLVPRNRRMEKVLQRDPEVWIANVNELPSDSAAMIRRGAQPTTGDNVDANSELHLLGNQRAGTAQSWNLAGQNIGGMQVKLVLAQNGKTRVVQQFNFTKGVSKCTSSIQLRIKDEPVEDQKRTLSANLNVSVNGMAFQGEGGDPSALPLTIEAPSTMVATPEPFQWPKVGADGPILLFAKAYWKDDLSFQKTIEGMIESSKRGGTFLYVTIEMQSDPDNFSTSR